MINGRDFEGQVVVVTGASSGLGRAICVEVASRGAATVVINYSSNLEGAQQTEMEVEQLGAAPIVVQGDVGEMSDCEKIVAAAGSAGHINVLFNNAGVTTFSANHGDLKAVSAEDFVRIYRVNVIGAYQMICAAQPLLEKSPEPSAVVNTTSLAGVAGIGSSLPYACSKGALTTMTLSLARSLGPLIRVNAIAPGFIDTDWYANDLSSEEIEQRRRKIAASTPLQVASSAEDLAGAAVFLGSRAARHITGETLLADAGLHLNFAPLKMS
ncbi:MAG: SDR family oxidoreductase [Halioglobus sp.]